MQIIEQITHSRPWIIEEDITAVQRVMHSGLIACGEVVKTFEEKVSEYNGCHRGMSFPSATFALLFVLQALGINEEHEVIIPDYVCSSVLSAVKFTGAKPVICDVGHDTWNMTPESVKACLTPRTGAIIAVHIFGIPTDVSRIKEFEVPVIEDCAQAFGTRCMEGNAGCSGIAGVYSFNATKCLATGEGGMIITKSPEFFAKLLSQRDKLSPEMVAFSDLQAALGISQLKRYDEFLKKREELADLYFDLLPDQLTEKLAYLKKGNIFFRFPVYSDFDFKRVKQEMQKSGIHVRKGVDRLLHEILGMEGKDYPHATEHMEKTISIPLYPSLDKENLRKIVKTLLRIIS